MASKGPLRAQTIRCELCGREAGQALRGVFYRAPMAPAPVAQGGVSRCGACGGHLGAIPDEPARYALDRLPVPERRWEPERRGRRPRVAPGSAGDPPR